MDGENGRLGPSSRVAMSSWGRWTVRILIVSFGLLMGAVFVLPAVRSASELGVTTDEAARRALQLAMVGGSLTGVGFVGLYVFVAFGFHDWASWRKQFTVGLSVPGGIRGRRRARRQIDGKEPYQVDEVAQLRRLAARLVEVRRSSPARWIVWMGNISVCMLLVGFIFAPPHFGVGTTWGPVVVQAFRILVGVELVAYVAAAVVVWRRQPHVKAEAFLLRTDDVPLPPDDEH